MCMMHAPINRKVPKVHKSTKKISKDRTPFNKELLKADPKFVDERRTEKVEDKGFFSKLLGL